MARLGLEEEEEEADPDGGEEESEGEGDEVAGDEDEEEAEAEAEEEVATGGKSIFMRPCMMYISFVVLHAKRAGGHENYFAARG